jgi:predicted nucleotidyltransferase
MGRRKKITEMIPHEVLARFVQKEVIPGRKVLQVAVLGAHACGFPNEDSPFALKGVYVEPTENLVGLSGAHGTINWVGEYDNLRVDFSAQELGTALRNLLRGDGSLLERVLAPRQLIAGEDQRRLQEIAKGLICRRFHQYYRTFSRGILNSEERAGPPAVPHLLSAYRRALTGLHLLRTGELVMELPTLSREYGMRQIEQLIELNRERSDAVLDVTRPWTKLLVRMQGLLDDAYENSVLPVDPEDPAAAEDYVLDMRRRFFDAMTLQG